MKGNDGRRDEDRVRPNEQSRRQRGDNRNFGGSRRGNNNRPNIDNSFKFRGSNSVGSRDGNNSHRNNYQDPRSCRGRSREAHHYPFNERYDGIGGSRQHIKFDDIQQDNAQSVETNNVRNRTASGDSEDIGFTKFRDPRRMDQAQEQQFQQRGRIYCRQFALHGQSFNQQAEVATAVPAAPVSFPITAPVVANVKAPLETETMAVAVHAMQEKHKEAAKKPIIKPEPTSPKSSSSSSSASSSSEEDVLPKQQKPKTPVITRSFPSSSSSSSSSKKEASPKNRVKVATAATPTAKTGLAANNTTNNSGEDVICVGNLERKYCINHDDDDGDDDDDDNDDKETDNKTEGVRSKTGQTSVTNNPKELAEQCMICDIVGHTSFQCQMICGNCSAPYHNLKSCPRPPNLAVMMQHFMEFCMQQMHNFKPNETFTLPTNFYATNPASYTHMPFLHTPLATTNTTKGKLKLEKTAKNSQRKKLNTKKSKKRLRSESHSDDAKKKSDRRKITKKTSAVSSDSDSHEGDEKLGDGNQNETTSSSVTESDASEPLVAPKHKKKKSKLYNEHLRPIYPPLPAFMPPAAAAYNPMLFGQMFPTAFPGMNYKR